MIQHAALLEGRASSGPTSPTRDAPRGVSPSLRRATSNWCLGIDGRFTVPRYPAVQVLQYGGRVCLPANSLSSPSQTMAMIPSRAMACAAAAVTATAAAIALKAVWRRRHAQRPSCPPISGAAQSSPVAPLSLGWSLTGKVVLITGAAQGVGLATARLCASAGASAIVLVDRQSDKGRTVEWELSRDCRFTSECLFVQCDVSVPAEVAAAVRQADARFGRIDCLVNAAGDTRRASLQETTVELWDALVAVNLRAPFLFTQAVSRIMQREGRGGYSVVNVASVQAHGGLTFCMACRRRGSNSAAPGISGWLHKPFPAL